ncbi:hypothetical protein [Aeoliella sp.]|uniref:hypothetical protein n=1 Tax=Aeoliella sp. TaxID=2795800 RepID=UPI003CCBEA52
MRSEHSKSIISRAKRLYAEKLQAQLEAEHRGRYVAIDPDSERYFLGDTFDEAVNAALDELPDQITHTIHIGHRAALHLGVCQQ